ncbi:hypothetical protein OG394_09430 [Kribbella sp. NBC_01245]|uniref:hypothetical protein n=1 Tax=Kribbella sp. NBC_01245 TaxID=2903578 RepID=UPI002E2C6B63|nr:hypothetical protein [Kribbella sp. NBC_01245]
MNVLAEVEQLHADLADWLGTEADAELLERFLAAQSPDFTLVDIEGRVSGLAALTEALAGARNAAPGLRITISDFHIVVQTSEVVVCRFHEQHSIGTSRRVTAVLLPDASTRNGLRWLSVHETASSQ